MTLAAQVVGLARNPALDLHTELGVDPMVRIGLVPNGSWNALLLGTTTQANLQRRAGTTVEIWEFAFQESPRDQTFRLFRDDIRTRLIRGFANPPASHTAIELSEFMTSDPSNPQWLDLTRARSLQERCNRVPPAGFPLR